MKSRVQLAARARQESRIKFNIHVVRARASELYIYWNDNCGTNFEANMAEIEARLEGMIQAPARVDHHQILTFRMKNLHHFM